MSELIRLDSMSDVVLKSIAQKPASISNLAFITNAPMESFGAPIVSLLAKGYIKSNLPLSDNEQPPTPHTVYTITLEGKAYLENIDRITKKERWQRRFNYFNATIATIALIKSFLPEIIAIWKLLMQ